MFTRRLLITMMGILSLSFLRGNKTAMAQFFFKPDKQLEPGKAVNHFKEGDKALIAVSGEKSPLEMVKEAVSLIGGFEKLDLKG